MNASAIIRIVSRLSNGQHGDQEQTVPVFEPNLKRSDPPDMFEERSNAHAV